MKWIRILAIGVLSAASARAGSITGTAFGDGGAMLLFAEAELYDAAGTFQESAAIDGFSGGYSFAGLNTGSYYVRVSAPLGSYLDEWYDDVSAPSADPLADGATPVSVTAGATTPGIDFVLSEGGSISGVVTDGMGTPIEFQSVEVYTASGAWVDTVLTGFGGVYTVPGLYGGSYAVRTRILAGSFADEWYDDVSAASDDPVADGATMVAVTAGLDTGAIDFSLSSGGELTGTLLGSGAPLGDESIEVVGTNGTVAATVMTQSNGAYLVQGLGDGAYYVRSRVSQANFVDEWIGGVVAYTDPVADGASLVSVTNGMITSGVDFDLTAGGIVSGQADKTDGPLALQSMELYRDDGSLFEVVSTDVAGAYSFSGLPAGTYYVRTRALPAIYFDEWHADVRVGEAGPLAAGATPIAVTGAGTVSGIDFLIGPAHAPIVAMAVGGGAPSLTWTALAGRTYQMTRTADPASGLWPDAPGANSLQTAPEDGPMTYIDTAPLGTACYRVELVP